MASEAKAVTSGDFPKWKGQRRRIAVLTAYDFTMAALLDTAGVDALLVGDSLGTVVQGHPNTLRVTLDQMVYHTAMVARGAKRPLVIGDLPFGSYQVSSEQAVASAIRLVQEGGCSAVKLEGGRSRLDAIRAIVAADIPVMGHVGMTPQAFHRFGGFKVQRDADAILDDAVAVAQAGAFAVVLECIPASLAARITAEIPVPTIGIGAGPSCDGQVLVTPDLLGLFEGFRPKFVRHYAEMATTVRDAVGRYIDDVRAGAFPDESESFK